MIIVTQRNDTYLFGGNSPFYGLSICPESRGYVMYLVSSEGKERDVKAGWYDERSKCDTLEELFRSAVLEEIQPKADGNEVVKTFIFPGNMDIK